MTDGERERSRRGQGSQLRAEILVAVNRLLDQWGSDEKLTMRAVAKDVGIAAPSIYLHFADKAELVWAALSDKYEQLAANMAAAQQAAATKDPREQLRAQIHEYCRFALENPGHYRLMYELRQPAGDPDKIREHPARLVSGRFRNALADCAEMGYPLTLPVHQAAHTLWTGLHGLVSINHSLSLDTPTEVVTMLADGTLDTLVGTERADHPGYPPTTEADKLIKQIITHKT